MSEPMPDWERHLLESTEVAERDERLLDILFNDITAAPTQRSWLLRSDRLRLRNYLWEQGWRREERPGDLTDLTEIDLMP